MNDKYIYYRPIGGSSALDVNACYYLLAARKWLLIYHLSEPHWRNLQNKARPIIIDIFFLRIPFRLFVSKSTYRCRNINHLEALFVRNQTKLFPRIERESFVRIYQWHVKVATHYLVERLSEEHCVYICVVKLTLFLSVNVKVTRTVFDFRRITLFLYHGRSDKTSLWAIGKIPATEFVIRDSGITFGTERRSFYRICT